MTPDQRTQFWLLRCSQKTLLAKANGGNKNAQAAVANRYIFGHNGVSKDLEKGIIWLKAAAGQGDPDSQALLGLCYLNGEGVQVDQSTALEWFRKSAEQNDPYGEFQLGQCYANGTGVPKDFREAVHWLRLAANQGERHAQAGLAWCYQYAAGVETNIPEAIKWFVKAADQGDDRSRLAAGLLYLDANYTNRLKEWSERFKGYRLIKKTAEHGVPEAEYYLGKLYQRGDVVSRDLGKAISWYQKAADQNNAMAETHLGLAYQYGQGVPTNLPQATVFYEKAASQGYEPAQKLLQSITSNAPPVFSLK